MSDKGVSILSYRRILISKSYSSSTGYSKEAVGQQREESHRGVTFKTSIHIQTTFKRGRFWLTRCVRGLESQHFSGFFKFLLQVPH